MTPKFKVGDVAVDLFTLRPVRVIRQSEFDNGIYLVKFEDGHEEWAREGNLRHRFEEVASTDDPDAPENDPVNHPSHYNRGKIEVIDFIADQGLNYCRGNAVKYISRAGYKNPDTEIEDLEKARFCIDYEIKRLKAKDG